MEWIEKELCSKMKRKGMALWICALTKQKMRGESKFHKNFQRHAREHKNIFLKMCNERRLHFSLVRAVKSLLLVSFQDITRCEYNKRRRFVDNNILFCGWPTKFRRMLELSLSQFTLPFGCVLIKQGSPVEGLHFLIE